MLIGFAVEDTASASDRDAEILRKLGCDRIYSAAQAVFVVDDVIAYLRPGDILAVTDLLRLGSDLGQIIETMERLHKEGIGAHVAGTEIVPGTALGDSFVKAGAILAEFSRGRSGDAASAKNRARGRPIALPPEAQVRAERLLKAGQTSVAEIARVLKVSPATVYRYFPRGRRGAVGKNENNNKGAGAARERPPRKRQ